MLIPVTVKVRAGTRFINESSCSLLSRITGIDWPLLFSVDLFHVVSLSLLKAIMTCSCTSCVVNALGLKLASFFMPFVLKIHASGAESTYARFFSCKLFTANTSACLGSFHRLPYNLYCVGGDVKHCSIQSSWALLAV